MLPEFHRSRRRTIAMLGSAVLLLSSSVPATATPPAPPGPPTDLRLEHVGSFFVQENGVSGDTSAEILDLTSDGDLMIYTDAEGGVIGFVDTTDPADPQAAGTIPAEDVTSAAIVRDRWLLVAVNTSDSFVDVSGQLRIYDLGSRAWIRTLELGGQPDAIAISPNGQRYAAIVIENERDEDLDDGIIPQLPGGNLQALDLAGQPDRWSLRTVDLTGLALTAPDDPEAEYVDINGRDEAVVSLQENNHLAIVDLRTASVINDFSAGSVTLVNVDATEEELGPQENGVITQDETITKRREPDSVAWVDDDTFATANEGDYEDAAGEEGGSRGFTLFNAVTGEAEWESNASFEHAITRIGHYPEGRSANKGVEPEGLEVGHWRGRTLLFVASERANVVGVYDVTDGTPELLQMLPTGIGPEGLKFTKDGTLVVTAEEPGLAAQPVITFFRPGAVSYPYIESADLPGGGGVPIPWVALSGLAGDPDAASSLWAVSDSILAQAYVYRIDPSVVPALIEERIAVGDPDGAYDFEGVAVRPDSIGGGFWFASEGRYVRQRVTEDPDTFAWVEARPNLLVKADASGAVMDEVPLPMELVDPAGNLGVVGPDPDAPNATSSGFEGVALRIEEGVEILYAVIQREWADDPSRLVKIARLDTGDGSWTFAYYPLGEPTSPNGGWVGLSEITLLPDGETFAVVERDNQAGLEARIKRVYGVTLDPADFRPIGEELVVVEKTLLADLLDELDAASISVPDKLEGLGVEDGRVHVATDNDGVDDNYGETIFLDLGSVEAALGGG